LSGALNTPPELSVIVPVLNETAVLPGLFRTLSTQREVRMEVVLCDGGSDDGTPELAGRLAGEVPFPVRLTRSPPGRGRQMNGGAAAAAGDTFLFLHADSSFPDPRALRKGLDSLAAAGSSGEAGPVAGRFALRFDRRDAPPSWGYYHLEWKARLDRPGCTHGDQGFLLGREFFAGVGPFDGSIPMLAETRLAEEVRRRGRWILLPAEIHTSARRFETEGLRQRQTLNAVICNFAAAGWEPFLRELPGLYRDHDSSGRLDLRAMLRDIGRLMAALPRRERFRLWYETGRFVRNNAWQLPLARDTRRAFLQGEDVGTGKMPALAFYDLHLDRLTDHPPGRVLAAFITWVWFRLKRSNHLQDGRK